MRVAHIEASNALRTTIAGTSSPTILRMAWSGPGVVEKGMIYWAHRLISRAFSGRLHEDFFGRAFEIFEEGRTQPSFHFPLWPAIPIASVFSSSPNESGGVAWKGSWREDDFESVCGLRNMFGQHIQNVVGPADKGFPHEAGSCVVEDPHPFQPVGENDRHGVHVSSAAAP
jgi:hypothetical protein